MKKAEIDFNESASFYTLNIEVECFIKKAALIVFAVLCRNVGRYIDIKIANLINLEPPANFFASN